MSCMFRSLSPGLACVRNRFKFKAPSQPSVLGTGLTNPDSSSAALRDVVVTTPGAFPEYLQASLPPASDLAKFLAVRETFPYQMQASAYLHITFNAVCRGEVRLTAPIL